MGEGSYFRKYFILSFFVITSKLAKNSHPKTKCIISTHKVPSTPAKESIWKHLVSALPKLIHHTNVCLFQTNNARLQILLNNELAQEHVLMHETGLNLASNCQVVHTQKRLFSGMVQKRVFRWHRTAVPA